MVKDDIAGAVLAALGGRTNVLTNTVCMTRLRVTLAKPQDVDYERLNEVHGVLGTAARGNNGLEVVFGPAMIDGIYHAFIKLTGREAGSDALFPMSRQSSNMRVQISPARGAASEAKGSEESAPMDELDMSRLEDLFGKKEEPEVAETKTARLLVINGPNINMLGLSGFPNAVDYPTLLSQCKQVALNEGFTRCDCFQSNHQGDLVDAIQDTYGAYEALVINPSTYGTSKSLRDSLRAVGIPSVEVHLGKLSKRDAVGTACLKMVSGKGTDGYQDAIRHLAHHLALRP